MSTSVVESKPRFSECMVCTENRVGSSKVMTLALCSAQRIVTYFINSSVLKADLNRRNTEKLHYGHRKHAGDKFAHDLDRSATEIIDN